MKLPEKLLTLRKRSGLSQEALAEKLGVSRQSVSRWELGTAQPELGSLLPLCRLFGVPAEALLDDAQDLPEISPSTPERKPRRNRRRLLGWLLLGMGLLGNGVFFLLSRLEKVPYPLVTREGGQTWYTWGAQETYSYRFFSTTGISPPAPSSCGCWPWRASWSFSCRRSVSKPGGNGCPNGKNSERTPRGGGMPLRRVLRPLYGKSPGQPPCSTAVRIRGSSAAP